MNDDKNAQENVTKESYKRLTEAYNHFNGRLFKNELPTCMIVLGRSRHAAGHFIGNIWVKSDDAKKCEISLNPNIFSKMSLMEIMQTLVHEMCHLWQHYFGNAGKNGWHNQEWGVKMKEVGLYPSDTGKEGGKEVGYRMGDYPIQGGKFEKAFKSLEEKGFSLHMISKSLVESKIKDEDKDRKKASKTKFSCPECKGVNAWGKPDLKLFCGCGLEMIDPTQPVVEGEEVKPKDPMTILKEENVRLKAKLKEALEAKAQLESQIQSG